MCAIKKYWLNLSYQFQAQLAKSKGTRLVVSPRDYARLKRLGSHIRVNGKIAYLECDVRVMDSTGIAFYQWTYVGTYSFDNLS